MSLADVRVGQERQHPAGKKVLLCCIPVVLGEQMLLGGAGANWRDQL